MKNISLLLAILSISSHAFANNLIIEGKSKVLILGADTQVNEEETNDGKPKAVKATIAITDSGETAEITANGPAEVVITGYAADAIYARYFMQKAGGITHAKSLTVNGYELHLAMSVAKSSNMTCTKPDSDLSAIVKMYGPEANPGKTEGLNDFEKILRDPVLKDYFFTRCTIKLDPAGNVVSTSSIGN